MNETQTSEQQTSEQQSPSSLPDLRQGRSFWLDLVAAFAYPLTGKALMMLLGAAVVAAVLIVGLVFVRLIPLGGFVAVFIWMLFLGYIELYVVTVLTDTAMGRDDPPDWPTGVDGAGRAAVLGLLALLVSGGPAIAAWVAVYQERLGGPGLAWVLTGAGVVYFPMALLSVLLHDGLDGLNPAKVLPAIARTAGAYAAVLIVFIVALLLGWLTAGLLALRLPIIGHAIGYGAMLAGLMVAARAMGLLYRHYRDRLGWIVE